MSSEKDQANPLGGWAAAMSEYLATHPDHDLTADDVVANALARARAVGTTFTADEVVEIANETSDSMGNLYRLDFIDRIRHEADVPLRSGNADTP